MSLALNFMGFQIGWFACVLSAAAGQSSLGIIVAVIILGFHLYCTRLLVPEFILMLSTIAIGLVWESLLMSPGWLYYPSAAPGALIAPLWLVALWALFSTTINVSMAWLKDRWVLASLMGAFFGPMAFIAGEKLGAVIFVARYEALFALAIGWALLMPFILWLADNCQHRFQFLDRVK